MNLCFLQIFVFVLYVYLFLCKKRRSMNPSPRVVWTSLEWVQVAASLFKPEIRLTYMQRSLVPNAWANQMSVKIASVPDHVFVPTWRACSLISSIKEVAATLKSKFVMSRFMEWRLAMQCWFHHPFRYNILLNANSTGSTGKRISTRRGQP